MIEQQITPETYTDGKFYNFMEYKKKKPFFLQPLKIVLGNPIDETYYMLKNIVYMDKQILALQQSHNVDNILLVEAIIIDGQLACVSMLPNELLWDISSLLEGTI